MKGFAPREYYCPCIRDFEESCALCIVQYTQFRAIRKQKNTKSPWFLKCCSTEMHILLIPGATCSVSETSCTTAHSHLSVDVCGSCGVIEESSTFRGRVRLTVNTRFIEPAWRSYRTIDRVGPSERDFFASQSEIIVWWIWANWVQKFVCHLAQKPWRTIHVPSRRRDL